MSPRSAYTNHLLRERSRARIVTAAIRLFARYGFHGTTTRMLARVAGVSEGLIYAHFRSKGGLLEEIFEERIAAVERTFSDARRASTADDRVEQLVEASFAVLRQELDFWRISYAIRMQPPSTAELGDQVGEWEAAVHTTLTRALRDAGENHPEIGAELLLGLLDGVSQRYAAQPDLYPLEAVKLRIAETYRWLRKRAVPPRSPAAAPIRRL